MKKSSILRLLALVTVFVFSVSMLAACGSQSAESTKSTTQAAAAASGAGTTTAADPKLDKSEYYEISVYAENLDPKFEQFAAQNSFRKMLKDKFNFGFKLLAYPGDPKEKLALDLASGEYPELVRLYSSDMVKKYAEAEALLDLTPLVEKYGPNFKARHESKFKSWQDLSGLTDGKMYVYVYGDPDMSYGVSQPFLEWVIRSDILEQQGYPNIANEEDFTNVIKKGLQDNPKTNGKPTLGLSYPVAAWGGNGASILGHIVNLGNMHHFTLQWDMLWDPATEQYVDKTKNYSWLEGYKFFNRLYREGLMDKESATDDYDVFAKKMEEGRALSTFFMTWGSSDWNMKLKEAGSELRYVPMTFMLKTQYEHGEIKRYNVGAGDTEWQTMAMTKNTKHPERLMEVLDYLASEEGQVRMGWGEEGVQYTVKDGKRVPTPEFLEKSKNDPDYKYTYQAEMMFGLSNTLDPNGQIYNITLDSAVAADNMDPKIKEIFGKYGWNSYEDMYLKNKNFKSELNIPWKSMSDPSTYDETQQKNWEKIVKTTQDEVIKLVIAKSDEDFQKAYDALEKKRTDLGVEGLIDIYNTKFKAWKASK